jgi:phage shock protein PspC (stress-responsive transcriptional regulator)
MKRLYRSRKERILGGICGGLGEHLDVDPTIIRLVWVVVTLLSLGTGILVYGIAWIIVPESPDESSPGTIPAV